MIVGTNTNAKITKITINNATATVTMLFFASKSTVPSKSFKLYLKDESSSELINIDNNVYWIDQVNNYDFDSNNIDINKHKEIVFTIDITKGNTSKIQSNHWLRDCYIYLIDTDKDVYGTPAWTSDKLSLVSDDFEIPVIKDISFDTVEIENVYDGVYSHEFITKGKIKAKFDLHYSSETDFNYNNKNFNAYMIIRSIATGEILEKKEISSSSVSEYNEITSTESYKLNHRINVELYITNKNDELLVKESKIYKPMKKLSNTFIKTKEGIKRVIAYHVATDAMKEHEGEYL